MITRFGDTDRLDPPGRPRLSSTQQPGGPFRRTACDSSTHHEGIMKLRTMLLAVGFAVAAITPGNTATLRFAFQGELKSLDPYSLNESFTLGMLGNVYEGLTKRDKDLKIIPGLAERWEQVEPTRWRFYLRKGVKFQNGEDFTADDVVFSAERSFNQASDIKSRIQPAGTKA